VRAAAHLATDQPGVLQRLDVFRGRRERHGKGLCKLAYRSFPTGELAKHSPTRGIAEGVKDGIELRPIFNHMVEYRHPAPDSQPTC